MVDSKIEKIEMKMKKVNDAYCTLALFMAGVAMAGLIRSNFNYRFFTTCFVIMSVIYLVATSYFRYDMARSRKKDPPMEI